jgi:hypothetical protein
MNSNNQSMLSTGSRQGQGGQVQGQGSISGSGLGGMNGGGMMSMGGVRDLQSPSDHFKDLEVKPPTELRASVSAAVNRDIKESINSARSTMPLGSAGVVSLFGGRTNTAYGIPKR